MKTTSPEDIRYMIERITHAEKKSKGWRLTVKWIGYDQPTNEPLSSIIRDTRGEPEIMSQVRECQERFLSEHPQLSADDTATKPNSFVRPDPTRILPSRTTRGQPQYTNTSRVLSIFGYYDHDAISAGCDLLYAKVNRRIAINPISGLEGVMYGGNQ